MTPGDMVVVSYPGRVYLFDAPNYPLFDESLSDHVVGSLRSEDRRRHLLVAMVDPYGPPGDRRPAPTSALLLTACGMMGWCSIGDLELAP